MKLDPIGINMTVLSLDSGVEVLFSYKTPVAAQLEDGTFCRTDKRWSVTTSKHISKWLAGARAEVKPQSFFDGLTG